MSEPTEAFEHWCEVCGKTEVLTSEEAYRTGWDFPPHMGQWGVISPRPCRSCPMNRTVWWAMAMDGYDSKQLSPKQREVPARIVAEGPDRNRSVDDYRYPAVGWNRAQSLARYSD